MEITIEDMSLRREMGNFWDLPNIRAKESDFCTKWDLDKHMIKVSILKVVALCFGWMSLLVNKAHQLEQLKVAFFQKVRCVF